MRITGARVAIDARTAQKKDFFVRDGHIAFQAPPEEEPVLNLSGYLILPGLINVHDHLELNLFPKLGSGFYSNAKQWAEEIYRPDLSPVKEHVAVDKNTRLLWGGLKNLFSGVTTVAHHNPYESVFDETAFPVRVLRRYGWAHSIDFSPDLDARFRQTPREWPFFLHAAEGTDAHAYGEIQNLDAMGLLNQQTVLVHAIGLDDPGLRLLQARRSSLAWCPSSNLALYGQTLKPNVFKSGVPVALGTDSAMTAQGDFIDEIATAQSCGYSSLEDIYEMATTTAARVLRLNDGQGVIRDGGVADLIACADDGQSPAQALSALQLELVLVGGKARLTSSSIVDRGAGCFHLPCTVELAGRGRWSTDVNISKFSEETAAILGREFRLAGKRVTV